MNILHPPSLLCYLCVYHFRCLPHLLHNIGVFWLYGCLFRLIPPGYSNLFNFYFMLYKLDYSIIQQATYCPLKSSGVVLQSPQKTNIPATGPATLKSVSSPQKSSVQGATFPSSPQKAEHSFSTSVPQSPLKNQVPFRGLSPQKPELHAKPSVVGNSVPQEKASTGAPGESCWRKVDTELLTGQVLQMCFLLWKHVKYCIMLYAMLNVTVIWQFSLCVDVNKKITWDTYHSTISV